jgi:hypothetical protein
VPVQHFASLQRITRDAARDSVRDVLPCTDTCKQLSHVACVTSIRAAWRRVSLSRNLSQGVVKACCPGLIQTLSRFFNQFG